MQARPARCISPIRVPLLTQALPPSAPAVLVAWWSKTPASRSEEHTSELQSLRHLVCRLLLEKKNHNDQPHHPHPPPPAHPLPHPAPPRQPAPPGGGAGGRLGARCGVLRLCFVFF